MVRKVLALDPASHTLAIGSCAPMPMLTAVQSAAHLYHGMTISSECKNCEPPMEGLHSGIYQIIILPCFVSDATLAADWGTGN